MQIHYQLATLKKGNSSIADYFHQFTTLVDTLTATALSVEVLPNSTGLLLSQKRYILNLLGNNEFIKKKKKTQNP